MATPSTSAATSRIRDDVRRHVLARVAEELRERSKSRTIAAVEPRIPGRVPQDGWTVASTVTSSEVLDALAAVREEDLAPPDDLTAEVQTPSEVLVWANCPRCSLPHAIRLFVSPVLTIDVSGSQLKLKASAKAAYHVCGQLSLAPVREAEGQLPAFDVPVE